MSTYCLLAASVISIHAPREGCDGFGTGDVSGWRYFNPRTPRGVRLDALRGLLGSHLISIHAPREGCDEFLPYPFDSRGAISIHAPREGCDRRITERDTEEAISIHAPREGCDSPSWLAPPYRIQFQSTHPARGATAALVFVDCPPDISIHAPREGCDPSPLSTASRCR